MVGAAGVGVGLLPLTVSTIFGLADDAFMDWWMLSAIVWASPGVGNAGDQIAKCESY